MVRPRWLVFSALFCLVLVVGVALKKGGPVTAAEEPSSGVSKSGEGDRAGRPRAAPSDGVKSSGAAGNRESAAGKKPRIVRQAPLQMSAEEAAFQSSLKPRQVPAKEPLHLPEGRDLRLMVKLADNLGGRADGNGSLVVRASEASVFQGLAKQAEAWDISFRRVHTVSDEKLAALSRRAAVNTGTAQADLAALVEVVLPAQSRTREQVVAVAQQLHLLAEVEYAELESLDMPPPPPAADIAPITPLLESYQTYRQAAQGVNVDHVWNKLGIRGDPGVRVTDCEYSFTPTHEDLSGLVQLQEGLVSMYTGFGNDHGTAVLGIVAGGWNAYGVTGSVPECTTRFYPEFSTLTTGSQSRQACVAAAIATSSPGDIVMLEMQADGPGAGSSDYVPAEYGLSVWNSVKTGSDAGVVTVAAAGNGNQNLDGPLFADYAARGDSGAIIVGAGSSARTRLSFSSYGTRVDVQGWGGGVFTTGYGTFATYGGDVNQQYASGFSGTSSATPVVVSAVALLQSIAKKAETLLSAAEMRTLLTTTGRPQTGSDAATAKIGPLPDLAAATVNFFQSNPGVPAALEALSSINGWGTYYLDSPSPDLMADPDRDGMVNLLEYLLGGDPSSALPLDAARAPHLTVTPTSGGHSLITFEFYQPAARTEVAWKVQSCDSLQTDSWQDLVTGADGVLITREGDKIVVIAPAEGRRFFRIQATVN